MKRSAITLGAAIVLAGATLASAQLTPPAIPSAKSIADGAKQGATDAANAEVEGAKAAATNSATKGVAPAADAASAASEKAAAAQGAADSAKQTGNAMKALGGH